MSTKESANFKVLTSTSCANCTHLLGEVQETIYGPVRGTRCVLIDGVAFIDGAGRYSCDLFASVAEAKE